EANMPMQLIRALAALLVVLATPAWAGSIALTGTVTYRERMALPPDAWLRVTLVELEGAVPVAGATASIPARGQVPLAFTLNVHSHVDALAGNHGLIAEISSAGRILFRNPIPAPVSASAQPVQITVNFSPQAVEPPAPQPPAPAILDTIWTVT